MPKASRISLSRSLKASLAAVTSSRNTHHAEPLQDTENIPPPLPCLRRATRARPDPPAPSALEELANLRAQHATLVDENLTLHTGATALELRLLDLGSELKREKETVAQLRREKKALQAALSAEESNLKKEQKNHRVMREGRTVSPKQQMASFQERIAADYCERAADHEYKASEKKRKEVERMARLKAVGLVTDIAAVEAMALVGLREQLEIHKDIIKDPVLNDKQQFKWGMVKTLAPRRLAVLAALERYRVANPEALGASEMLTLLPSPMEDVTEPCGTHSDIEMDSDEEYMGDEFF
ncbi:hypothetical protein GGG16DRAFT_64405 [Schizophyllum commune]